MKNNEEYDNTRKDCDQKIEERKTEFNQMKRDLKAISDLEVEIKASLDQVGQQKNKQKDKCAAIKASIKSIREKFKK